MIYDCTLIRTLVIFLNRKTIRPCKVSIKPFRPFTNW